MRSPLFTLSLLVLASAAIECRADYVVVGQRASNFTTIGTQAYDRVSISVYNDGTNGTAPPSVGFPSVQSLAVALFAPKHGMLIGVNGSSHQPDLFGSGGGASLADASWIDGKTWAGFNDVAAGQQILLGSGSSYSVDQSNGSGMFGGTYTDLEAVAGITGDFFTSSSASWPNIGPTSAGAKMFAQVVVAHGDPVFVLPPTSSPYNRVFPSTQFEPSGTAFGIPTVSGPAGVVPANNTPGVLRGDANLDGVVNSQDLQLLLSRFNTSGTTWTTGDFNGDGLTNSADLQGLLSNFNHNSIVAVSPALVPAPEPTATPCIAALVLAMLRRRRV